MNNNEKKVLSQMLNRGIMDDQIIKIMQDNYAEKTKEMIKNMGTKYCCHLSNAPKKSHYGI